MTVRFEPIWIKANVALAIHDRQLAEHGGGLGLRDAGALDSALARARNSWEYGQDDLASLAADLAFGIVRNHPFVDGNKRTGWVVARLFLRLNGAQFTSDEMTAIKTVEALAAGSLSQDELADWFRQRTASR